RPSAVPSWRRLATLRGPARRPPSPRRRPGGSHPLPTRRNSRGSFLLARALLPERLLSGGRYLNPFLVRRCIRDVTVVPVPPLVGRRLGIALGRILPELLPAKGGDVEVVPGAAQLLVAAVVEEVGAENTVAVAVEDVRAVPLVHAEIGVEAVGDGDPGDVVPAHPLLEPRDVGLRCARCKDEGGIAGVQVRDVRDLVGNQGAAAAGVVRPAKNARLEECAVDDQLTPALEQVEQAYLATRPLERIRFVDGHPGHLPALGGQCITSAGIGLFLDEQLLAGGLPFLRRHDRWCMHDWLR